MKPYGFFAALLVAVTGCSTRREQPPVPVASSARSPSSPLSPSTPPPSTVEALPSLKGFEDSARHYRNASGRSDYARHPPGDFAAIAENVLLHQRRNGGWSENWDPARVLEAEEKAKVLGDKTREDSSFDNRSTYTHVEYLLEVFRRAPQERFREAAVRGLELMLAAQHPCGLFPHSFPKAEGYRAHLTLMDDVTVGVLSTFRKAAIGLPPFDVLDPTLRARLGAAARRGEDCLVKLQVVVRGEPTGWAGQYDEATLVPTSARSFELPGLVSDESVEVVRYLMGVRPPRPEVTRAVESAAKWLERSQIKGLRVETVPAEPVRYQYHTSTDDRRAVADANAPPIWARFYELDTNRPFMANRDGKKVYQLADVERERRTGYRWYGAFATELLERELPAWRAVVGVESRR